MPHPSRVERADEIARIIEEMMKQAISRYVHMSTNDDPLLKLHEQLVAALAAVVR